MRRPRGVTTTSARLRKTRRNDPKIRICLCYFLSWIAKLKKSDNSEKKNYLQDETIVGARKVKPWRVNGELSEMCLGVFKGGTEFNWSWLFPVHAILCCKRLLDVYPCASADDGAGGYAAMLFQKWVRSPCVSSARMHNSVLWTLTSENNMASVLTLFWKHSPRMTRLCSWKSASMLNEHC